MGEKEQIQAESIEQAHVSHKRPDAVFDAPLEHVQEFQSAEHVNLSWRSWVVVFVTCFAIMAQVFVVVAAGSVIAFIIRDLGEAPIAGWVIREIIVRVSDTRFPD